MNPQLAAILGAGAIMLGLSGMVWIQSHRLDIAEQELKVTQERLIVTQERLASTTRALDELERDYERSLQRKTASRNAQEAIKLAPEGDNGAVAPILVYGLEQADIVGGAP
ncbi:hypothetical protein [Devosia faecipullorum]|uniref:hypothetical protein n=1 Tax=Devosia faecipullorum TaxID=2755039 RepID=UPI00187B54F8|nr:hypothetical protein [Devosia faecipullorum]MBE7732188.1 hypothetical protein [Devosia faecipullorum]